MIAASPLETQPNGSSLRLLLVDDDVAASDALSRILIRKGHVVRHQSDSTCVIAAAREFQPHVVVLDYQMPGCDGATVAWQLVADPELRRVRVVVVSGYDTEEIRKSLPPSVIPVLSKPLDMDALLRLLEDGARGPADV